MPGGTSCPVISALAPWGLKVPALPSGKRLNTLCSLVNSAFQSGLAGEVQMLGVGGEVDMIAGGVWEECGVCSL